MRDFLSKEVITPKQEEDWERFNEEIAESHNSCAEAIGDLLIEHCYAYDIKMPKD